MWGLGEGEGNNFIKDDRQYMNPRGYSNYFSTGCAAQGLKPSPISKDFSPSEND